MTATIRAKLTQWHAIVVCLDDPSDDTIEVCILKTEAVFQNYPMDPVLGSIKYHQNLRMEKRDFSIEKSCLGDPGNCDIFRGPRLSHEECTVRGNAQRGVQKPGVNAVGIVC
jgi:hypothetical protein